MEIINNWHRTLAKWNYSLRSLWKWTIKNWTTPKLGFSEEKFVHFFLQSSTLFECYLDRLSRNTIQRGHGKYKLKNNKKLSVLYPTFFSINIIKSTTYVHISSFGNSVKGETYVINGREVLPKCCWFWIENKLIDAITKEIDNEIL